MAASRRPGRVLGEHEEGQEYVKKEGEPKRIPTQHHAEPGAARCAGQMWMKGHPPGCSWHLE